MLHRVVPWLIPRVLSLNNTGNGLQKSGKQSGGCEREKCVHVQYEYNVWYLVCGILGMFGVWQAGEMVQRDVSFSSCCVMSITCML